MGGRIEPFGLPGPRQQPLELVGLGPTRDHALENVGEPVGFTHELPTGERRPAGDETGAAFPARFLPRNHGLNRMRDSKTEYPCRRPKLSKSALRRAPLFPPNCLSYRLTDLP